MEIKFFSNGKVMDLSGQKVSVSESNSKMSDKIFTKYLFPFEFYMDEKFKNSFGDYSSFESYNLPKLIDGILLYNNVYTLAKFEIISVEGDYLTGQIDFGFEDIPNFSKPLKELPLEKYKVENIHTFAAEICNRKYPLTNFNFPRLYNAQFSPEDELWDAYNGYYNDLDDNGTAMRSNYVTDEGVIYNQNIIHPMPHILYLLKSGFEDVKYTLSGDILLDPFLQDIWVYSGTEYFSRLTLRKLGLVVSVMDYKFRIKKTLRKYPFGFYNNSVKIPKPGNYKIVATIMLATHKSGLDESWIKIKLNGNTIFYRTSEDNIIFGFETDITTTQVDEVINVYGYRSFADGDSEKYIDMKITSKNAFENEDSQPGEDNGVITNINEIDLCRAVPDITFGEFVNRIRNFLNYDIAIEGKTIIMNRIKKSNSENIKIIPERFLEKQPVRNILNKKSFAFMMPSWENDEKADSVYYDKSGIYVNKKPDDSTVTYETNTYALPVFIAKPLGHETAVVKSYDSTLLQLVKYDGKIGIQNNAKPAPELTFPTLFYSNWEDFLKGRLNSQEYNWEFTAEDDEINFTIKDEIFCYNNKHNIKEWVKDYVGDSVVVNITTETIN